MEHIKTLGQYAIYKHGAYLVINIYTGRILYENESYNVCINYMERLIAKT